ncbi:hypothetical protein [Brevundimonas variabilis]|uniref:Uncharacterized protein n=1 Tax=Brevundimonas variabilis TaxID=74312 RepID=A0A7W9CGM1_9CAUL|nr:hypothetical protein [Brevundimonas variabilis]MBB5745204.1 hypothetical protein [Brevundimonas variabilis]
MQTDNDELVRRWIVQFLEAPTLIDADLMIPILEEAEAVMQMTERFIDR